MSLPKKPWETSTSSSLPARSSTVDSTARNTTSTTTSTVSRPATAQSTASSALTMQDQQGMNSYGGAYGNRFGTTGYGYGTSGYGYGGGYGGYGGGMYGGGMYGGGMYGGGMYGGGMYGGGPMMDPNGGMGWLVSFNQTVGAIGQITQVLGMNAESLNFCFGSFVHFMERMAFLCTNAVAMLSPKPDFPPGHPRYGEPPETEEEIKSRLRRVRVVKFLVGLLALYAASRIVQRIRNLWRTPKTIKSHAAALERVFATQAMS